MNSLINWKAKRIGERFVLRTCDVSWQIESCVTGEIVLWKGMMKEMSVKELLRHIRSGWKYWFFYDVNAYKWSWF